MIFKFALRNIFRNKKRTVLTIISILFAAMIVGLAQGWVNGLMDAMESNYIKYQTGHIRITTKEYIKRERFIPVDEIIYNSGRVIEDVKKIDGVKSVEERIRFGMLLGKGEKTEESVGMGLDLLNSDLDLSSKLTDENEKIESQGLYLGYKLAEKLGVKKGEELLIATKTSEGGLNGIKLEVKGLLKFGMKTFDSKFFFMDLGSAKELLKIYDGTTEIFVFLKNIENLHEINNKISIKLDDDLVSEDYITQMGDMYGMFQMAKIIYYFIESMIMFLGSFVVINTMMMSIYERMREIGTLKAIGMTDKQLFWNFTCEGAILGAIGGAIGAICGYMIIVYFSISGINMEAFMASIEAPVEYIVYPHVSIIQPFIAIFIAIIIPALASMIPARNMKKYMPADALRK